MKTVTVFGATGTSAGGAARHFLEGGWQVRAVTRETTSAKAKSIADRGATLIVADLNDRASLRPAIEGADAVYLATPSLADRWDTGQASQGINVADAAAEVGVGHFIYQSALVASGRGVLSLGSKRAIEERIAELELPATITRPSLFMDNLINFFPPKEKDGALFVAQALPADKPQTLVSAEDIGRAALAIADRPSAYIGKAIDLVADTLSPAQMATTIGDAVGKPCHAIEVPISALEGAWPQGVPLYKWLSTRNDQDDATALTKLVGQPITFASWVKSHLLPHLAAKG